jgi:hypothetical protein
VGVVIGLGIVVVLGLGIASLFLRRHGESDRPEASWRPTDEVFKDPTTQRTMRVWVDAAGERHYVPES